jgi:hypothetical protein
MQRPDGRHFLSVAAVGIAIATAACGPPPPSSTPGTPEFYWKAAHETFASADYDKTNHNLEQLIAKPNAFSSRAQPWRLIITAGMVRGYSELADNFEYGARSNKTNPTPFRTQMSLYRQMAGQAALQFAETLLEFNKRDRSQPVPLDFSYPSGSSAKVPELTKIANGIPVQEAEIASIEKRTLQRGVLTVTFDAVGAPNDAAKTQALFKAGNVQVPVEVFDLAIAKNLFEFAKLFDVQKLDQPQRVEFFCKLGMDMLKGLKPSPETKKLSADFEKLLKSVKKR